MSDRIAAGKAFHARSVSVHIHLKCVGFSNGHVNIDGATELTTEQARALAQSLVAQADAADAKADAKAAVEQRKQNWRDREVAGG
jgi:hypothetical protein